MYRNTDNAISIHKQSGVLHEAILLVVLFELGGSVLLLLLYGELLALLEVLWLVARGQTRLVALLS